MYSANIHSLLAQAHVDELTRTAATSRSEMAASMMIPAFALMAILWSGIAKRGLMVPEHAGMLTCMLVAMLLRRDQYSCAAHAHRHAQPAVAG